MFPNQVNPVVIQITLIFTIELFRLIHGELRFCLNGPHIMKDDDCPGGFVFNEKVKPTCKFYAKTGNHSQKVLSAPTDVCDEKSVRAIEDEEDDLADIEELTWLTWENIEVDNPQGVFEPANICKDECLPEWMGESVLIDEEPIKDDFDPSSVSEELKESFSQLNMGMFMQIIMDENSDDRGVPHAVPPGYPPLPTAPGGAEAPPTNIEKGGNSRIIGVALDPSQLNVIKLLARSFRVAISACSPFVPEEFFEQLLKGMSFIAKSFEGKILDVEADSYMGIARILDHCTLKRQQEFTLNGTKAKCGGETGKVEGIHYPHKNVFLPHRLSRTSFHWGKYHPILDATWTTIDLIQSFCFESFEKDMMLSHVFNVAMEELFPPHIQLFWRLNPEVKNDKIWNNLMETQDLNATMRNLDACAVAARNASPSRAPLPRPFLTITDLEKPAPESKLMSEPEKGWKSTIEKYWKLYEKQGGFKKVSEKFGRCFQDSNTEEQIGMIDKLKNTCS